MYFTLLEINLCDSHTVKVPWQVQTGEELWADLCYEDPEGEKWR